MATLRNFDTMWDAYPNPGGTAAEARSTIGGAVDAQWVRNTCVVRVSRALNRAGHPIPRSSTDEILTLRGGDGMHYALRVHEFARYLRRRYGSPDVDHTYPSGSGGDVPSGFRGRRGVALFDVDIWSDATGHVDLWNGRRCRHAEYFDVSSRVMLWEVEGDPAGPALIATVGVRAVNRVDDVQLVQRLLSKHGFDPGRIDGELGRQTIAAIREFQGGFMRRPDGRVDPNGRTFRELLGL